MTDVKPSKIESTQLCLLLCLLALGTNFFLSISVVGDTRLLFGASFAFIGIMVLPFMYALPIAFSVLISFLFAETGLPQFVIFVAEFAALAYLRQRNIFILMASLLFWISLGVPSLWALLSVNASFITDSSLILTLQTALNGILNAAIAATIVACLPKEWIFSRALSQHRLSTNIFTICASTLVLPLLILSFVFIYQGIHLATQSKIDDLTNRAKLLDNVTTNFITSHQNVISRIAEVISAGGNQQKYQELMIESQANFPTFFNITQVAKDGALGFFAPTKYNALIANIPKDYKNIKDRYYFEKAKESLQDVISDTFLSRGIVIAPMIAIASPVVDDGEFNGIVYGALNLFGISSFEDQIKDISDQKVIVITDQNHQIVFSNQAEQYKTLELLKVQELQSKVISELPLMTMRSSAYIYSKTSTINGWHVFVIDPVESISTSIKNQFILVSVGLLVVLTIFLVFAYKLSNKITQPLTALLKDEEEFSTDELYADYTSREISDMAKKLKRTSYLMRNFESRLKLQVEEKTEQLEQLNLQLAAQAREDGLTGLYNRSGFNELAINAIKTSYRIAQTFSVVLVDIDHFKNINDTYGHLLGDECLVEFSAMMQNHCKRDTDIIGRYGGEEFIIFLSGTDVQAQHNIINDIHQKTRFISVNDADSGKSVGFTVSIGVCTVLSPVNLELSELINIADDELYRCKRSGRDRVSISTIGD